MLHLLYGPAASGKTDLLMGRIRTAVAARTPGQVLLVPEQYSHEAERALCAACGDSLSLYAEVLSFTGLARRVAAETGAGEVAARSGRAAAVHGAGTEPGGRRGCGCSARPPAGRRCSRRSSARSTSSRPRASRPTRSRPRPRAAPAIWATSCATLRSCLWRMNAVTAQGHADPTDRLTRLAERIPASALGHTGHFYLDGFTDYTRQELAVVRALL